MKKIIAAFCVFVMVFTMAGCKENTAVAESETMIDYSNTSLTGKVTSIEESVVTLQLGELTADVHGC